MAYEVKDSTGFLYNNKNRTTDKHPLLKGYLVWKGERVQIAAWLRQDRDGTDMFALAAEETRQQTGQPQQQYQPKPAQAPPTQPLFQYKKPVGEPLKDDEFDPDEIPF